MRSNSLVRLWQSDFISKSPDGYQHCGLCGNFGIIRRDDVKTPAGVKLDPLKAFCICPNGQIMKRKKCKL